MTGRYAAPSVACDCCNVTGAAPAHGRLVRMAGDKRATRLGVLALVATMLFGVLGVRLWFLQAVEASSLQAAVDESSLRTVLIPPVRGQIIDADGRLLAGNEATNTVAVDWAQIRKASDRATLFQRLSGWLGVTVADMEGATRPTPTAVPPAAARRGRARERRDRDPGALRGLPRRVRAARLSTGLPVRPAGVATDRLHGRDHRGHPGLLPQPRLRHVEPRRARRPCRHRAAVRDRVARHVGPSGGRDRRRRPGGAAGQRDAAGERPGHPAVDRPRPAAVRRADAADRSCASSGRSSPPTRSSRSPTAATSGWTSPRARRCTTRPRRAR